MVFGPVGGGTWGGKIMKNHVADLGSILGHVGLEFGPIGGKSEVNFGYIWTPGRRPNMSRETYDGTLLGKHLGASWGPEDPSKNPRESQGTPGNPRESRELLGHHRKS